MSMILRGRHKRFALKCDFEGCPAKFSPKFCARNPREVRSRAVKRSWICWDSTDHDYCSEEHATVRLFERRTP